MSQWISWCGYDTACWQKKSEDALQVSKFVLDDSTQVSQGYENMLIWSHFKPICTNFFVEFLLEALMLFEVIQIYWKLIVKWFLPLRVVLKDIEFLPLGIEYACRYLIVKLWVMLFWSRRYHAFLVFPSKLSPLILASCFTYIQLFQSDAKLWLALDGRNPLKKVTVLYNVPQFGRTSW